MTKKRTAKSESAEYWLRASEEELARAYAEAALDVDREREALEWCEALIGETLEDEDFSDWPGYPARRRKARR